jgi:hypothetical protein
MDAKTLNTKLKTQSTNVKLPRVYFWIVGVWCVMCLCSATSFTLINTYDTKANLVTVDNFRNFYAAADNKLYKFSPEGAFLYPYEEFKYGKIGMIDANNPLKTYVFYPDFMTVVTLDKFLAPLTVYSFLDLGYQNITAVAASTDGRLWFYDNTDFKLKKIDETGKVYLEGQPLNLIIQETPNPNFMMEKEGRVYVNDPAVGILVFDIFGSYNKTIPIKGLTKFQVLQDQVIYFDNSRMNSYNQTTLELKTLSLPDSTGVTMAAIEKDRIAVLKKDQILFYKY